MFDVHVSNRLAGEADVSSAARERVGGLVHDFERAVAWTRHPEEAWSVWVYDRDRNLLELVIGENLDDLLLEIAEKLQPPSD